MRISATTEYAAIAALELARCRGTADPVRLRSISEGQGVPEKFLVQILLQLKAAGLVTSTRGAAGGYRLARPPEDITLADIRGAIEGDGDAAPATAELAGRSRAAAALAAAWDEGARAEADALRGVSLADLLDRCRSVADAMYYI